MVLVFDFDLRRFSQRPVGSMNDKNTFIGNKGVVGCSQQMQFWFFHVRNLDTMCAQGEASRPKNFQNFWFDSSEVMAWYVDSLEREIAWAIKKISSQKTLFPKVKFRNDSLVFYEHGKPWIIQCGWRSQKLLIFGSSWVILNLVLRKTIWNAHFYLIFGIFSNFFMYIF